MARKPFYRKAARAWYILHRGKQVRLHADRAKAFQKWATLELDDGQQGAERAVHEDISDFIAWTRTNRGRLTFKWYARF